jgi:hypothetical protein
MSFGRWDFEARNGNNEMANIVPMEEIVRAFNYVIEKGWVSLPSHLAIELLSSDIFCSRPLIGELLNGLHTKLRKLIVCVILIPLIKLGNSSQLPQM